MDTIGSRAHKEISNRAYENGIAPYKEAAKLGVDSCTFSAWRQKTSPSAYYLRRMLLHGYDVIYILAGDRLKDVPCQESKVSISL